MSIVTPSRDSHFITLTDIYHCFETAERNVIVVARILALREHRPLRGDFFCGVSQWLPIGYARLAIRSSKTQSRLTIDSGFSNEKVALS